MVKQVVLLDKCMQIEKGYVNIGKGVFMYEGCIVVKSQVVIKLWVWLQELCWVYVQIYDKCSVIDVMFCS